jgi:hypothetical protein
MLAAAHHPQTNTASSHGHWLLLPFRPEPDIEALQEEQHLGLEHIPICGHWRHAAIETREQLRSELMLLGGYLN